MLCHYKIDLRELAKSPWNANLIDFIISWELGSQGYNRYKCKYVEWYDDCFGIRHILFSKPNTKKDKQ